MKFENLNNEEKNVVSKKKPKDVTTKINGVTVFFNADEEDDVENIKTFQDLLKFDKKKPGAITRFSPKLYSIFTSKVNKTIETYVNKGDTVKYASPAYVPIRNNIDEQFTVKDITLNSLGSMSVLVAELSNGDIIIPNKLIKV